MKNHLYRVVWYDKGRGEWKSESFIAYDEEDAYTQWIGIDILRKYIKPDYYKIECVDEVTILYEG